MRKDLAKRVVATDLRVAGRQPEMPFCVVLADGGEVCLHRLLRVLPGKRIVGEGEWNGRRVLAKLFIATRSERHWRQEKAGIEALQNAGIPTPELLLATPLPKGGYLLLTAFLDDAQSLLDAWTPLSGLPAGNPIGIDLLRPAFGLLGTLHACGLVQEDLHLGNFLRSGGRLYAIDGDAVRAISPGKPLDATQATTNLAMLLAQLPIGWDAHREAFLAAYSAGGGVRIGDTRRLERETRRVRDWRLNDYLGKTVRDCTLFSVKRSAFRFTAVQRDIAASLAALLNEPDVAVDKGKRLKDGRTCTVAQVELPDRTVVVKRYNLKNVWHALERFWRPSRAWHSWREGHRLRFFGLATPAPLALIEERVGPLRRRAFLVNAFCPGIDLMDHLSPDCEPDAETASAILGLFETLHRLRISHGDFKATNLLWHDGRLVVIDLDAMTQHVSARSFARAWRRDRARFLRNWPATSVLHVWLDRHLPAAE